MRLLDEAREGFWKRRIGREKGKGVMPTSEGVAPRFLLIPHFPSRSRPCQFVSYLTLPYHLTHLRHYGTG